MIETRTREDEQALRSSLRQYFGKVSTMSEVRRLMETDSGYDSATWRQMAGQLGIQGLHIPEVYGGQGFSFVELCVALEEMGRTLFCGPFFSSVCLAANVILSVGSEEQKQALLPAIASGDRTAALAVMNRSGFWDPACKEVSARQGDHGQFPLTGHKYFVIDGGSADVVLVAARTADSGMSLFVVDREADGLAHTKLFTMDQTRKFAHLHFADVQAEPLNQNGCRPTALEEAIWQAMICLACEQLGGAERALEMAVEYAKTRIQFGRKIGSFQAVKHHCVDLLLQVDYARSTAYHAARVASESVSELPLAASLAKLHSSQAYLRVAEENIQIQGGIGFTWEHDAHLYLKRAKSSEVLLGDRGYHRNKIGDLIGV